MTNPYDEDMPALDAEDGELMTGAMNLEAFEGGSTLWTVPPQPQPRDRHHSWQPDVVYQIWRLASFLTPRLRS
jgi:hypothetical protein